MTPYFDAWVAALERQDSVMCTLFLMALAIIAAWVLYTDIIRPHIAKNAAHLIPVSFWVLISGGFGIYWLTVALYAVEAAK